MLHCNSKNDPSGHLNGLAKCQKGMECFTIMASELILPKLALSTVLIKATYLLTSDLDD